MASYDRRAAARRKAWGRGPTILRFEPLEGRQLMTSAVIGPAADITATQFNTVHSAYWGDLFHASGAVANIGIARLLYVTDGNWTPSAVFGAMISMVWNYAMSATLVWDRR